MYTKIQELAKQYQDETISLRRDFHRYPERGWLEVRTASLIARKLEDLGYQVYAGKDVVHKQSRMGLPHSKIMKLAYHRAMKQDADPYYAEIVKDGFTGVVGVLKNGEGPVIGLRFDIDALGVEEDNTATHFPKSNHFASANRETMHACGHDGHIAIGLTTAKILMQIKDSLKGTIKLIFQPAEEGVRGAKSMVRSGILDDIDYLYAAHIFPRDHEQPYDIYLGMNEAFATTKLDVYYHGVASHAAGTPQFGKNAILSAASCILNLHSIPRNSDGCTRINVGTIVAGTDRNVVAETAKLEIEVRGASTSVNQYMELYARDVIQGAALMHDTAVEVKEMGKAYSLDCSLDFKAQIYETCENYLPELLVAPALEDSPLNSSDDFSYMMHHVQSIGGKATYMMLIADTAASLHNNRYNFNEDILQTGTILFSSIAYTLLHKTISE